MIFIFPSIIMFHCWLVTSLSFVLVSQLQVDGSHSQNLNSKASISPNLSQQDFPALPLAKAQNGFSKLNADDIGRTPRPYTSSNVFGGATDYASTVRKLPSQESGPWKYGRNVFADVRIGSSRMPQLIANSQTGHEKKVYGDKVHSAHAAQVAPVWLETGEAVGNAF